MGVALVYVDGQADVTKLIVAIHMHARPKNLLWRCNVATESRWKILFKSARSKIIIRGVHTYVLMYCIA